MRDLNVLHCIVSLRKDEMYQNEQDVTMKTTRTKKLGHKLEV